jgi:LmbE family N-acetylglucosaminyl deacetylase
MASHYFRLALRIDVVAGSSGPTRCRTGARVGGGHRGFGDAVRRTAAKVIQHRAFALMRRVLVWRGSDVTDQLTSRSCLVIAPHPDDETLGCGATIARTVEAGCDVRVVVATDGRDSHQSTVISADGLSQIRRAELVEACRILGVPRDHVIWLGCEDGRLGRHTDFVRQRMADTIAEFGPAQVLSPSGIDEHADHRALASVIRGLIGDGTIRCPVYEYPIWFFHARTWLPGGRATPWGLVRMAWRLIVATFTIRPVTVRTAGVLERKRQALTAFTSQTANLTGEPGWAAALGSRFVSNFLGPHEIFFPLPAGRGAERGWRRADP